MMMLNLYVLQHQWIVMALLAGVALTLVFCLTYQALWLPRGIEGKSEIIKVKDIKSFFTWITQFMPWVLILLIVATVAFTIIKVVENKFIGGIFYYQIMNGITGTGMPYFKKHLESEKIWDLSNYLAVFFLGYTDANLEPRGIDASYEGEWKNTYPAPESKAKDVLQPE